MSLCYGVCYASDRIAKTTSAMGKESTLAVTKANVNSNYCHHHSKDGQRMDVFRHQALKGRESDQEVSVFRHQALGNHNQPKSFLLHWVETELRDSESNQEVSVFRHQALKGTESNQEVSVFRHQALRGRESNHGRFPTPTGLPTTATSSQLPQQPRPTSCHVTTATSCHLLHCHHHSNHLRFAVPYLKFKFPAICASRTLCHCSVCLWPGILCIHS